MFDNIKNTFKKIGDKVSNLDKEIGKMRDYRILPKDVAINYDKLVDAANNAESNYMNSEESYESAKANAYNYFSSLEEKRAELSGFTSEHPFSIIRYNIPIPFFPFISNFISANAREYHNMKREIRYLKSQHKFWSGRTKEGIASLKTEDAKRKKASRDLDEYKRIMLSRKKAYSDVINMIYEMKQMIKLDTFKELQIRAPEVWKDINSISKLFVGDCNWYYMENPYVDNIETIKRITKILKRCNKGNFEEQDLTELKQACRRIRDKSENIEIAYYSRENSGSGEETPEKKKKEAEEVKKERDDEEARKTKKEFPQKANVKFSCDTVDRSVVERYLKDHVISADKSINGLKPEQFMAFLMFLGDTVTDINIDTTLIKNVKTRFEKLENEYKEKLANDAIDTVINYKKQKEEFKKTIENKYPALVNWLKDYECIKTEIEKEKNETKEREGNDTDRNDDE